MKILMAYDASVCAEAALESVTRAGLPDEAQVVVLSVAESKSVSTRKNASADDEQDSALNAVRSIAASASRRLSEMFPKWRIAAESAAGKPQSVILEKIETMRPDLVVVGSHGRSGFKRLVLGSVSHFILSHSPCSVRIGRRHVREGEIRLLIGVDGSAHALAAVQCVTERRWPAGTQVRVVSVVDSRAWILASSAESPGTVYSPVVEEQLKLSASRAVEQAEEILTSAGLPVDAQVRFGMPGEVLNDEAEQWNADCVFVGARGLNALGRILLGSVSSAVAVHAPCSVEVVRPAKTGASSRTPKHPPQKPGASPSVAG